MNVTTEYTIISGSSPKELIKNVNEKIKDGWQPLGGLSFSFSMPIQKGGLSYQKSISQHAMFKY